MVVGVRKSLEEGRTYSYEDLAERYGLRGAEFERVLDYLVERGCLKPKVFECSRSGAPGCSAPYGAPACVRCSTFEYQLRWEA